MQALQRLLFVFSKLNSGLKYVQGMNELVAPLYMVFCTDAPNEDAAKGAEADAFFCFIRVLTVSETRDLYCKTLDTATTGVASVMAECVYSPTICACFYCGYEVRDTQEHTTCSPGKLLHAYSHTTFLRVCIIVYEAPAWSI
jgi:Rab-GTPase-TBC domain